MITYIKARAYNKTNGEFKGNFLIVKQERESHADFFAVARTADITLGDLNLSAFTLGSEASFSASEGVNSVAIASHVHPVNSFSTTVIACRRDRNSVLFPYRISLSDEVFTLNEVFTSVDLDDVFLAEQRQTFQSSGVLIKPGYTQNEVYTGFGSYHSNQRRHTFNTPIEADKPWRIGIELEVYARTQAAYDRITSARTNWFQCEADGSLNQHSWPIELKTIPLKACDAKSVDFWAEPMRKLGELAVSKGFTSTGLHVHISKEILGSTEQERQNNLNKLCTFYTYYVEDDPAAHAKNVTICGRQQGYAGSIAGTKSELGEFAKKIGINKVAESADAFKQMADSIKAGYSNQRWDINLGNWNSYGTVEFRKADGRISKTRLAAVVTWWEQMCLYCKETHPKDFSFDAFFGKVCREYPAVAFFFNQDDEC